MTSHILEEALSADGHLGPLLELLTPRHALDVAAAATLASLGVAYLFPKWTWDRPDPYEYIYYEKPQSGDGAGSAGQTTRNIAQRLEEINKDIVIFWGSQSGTSEGLAGRLARELHRLFGLGSLVADLSDFDPESIAQIPQTRLAIFLLSTYGEGDPSDNASQFWSWATKINKESLGSLRYVAFGLGNSNYRHYNEVAKRVTAILDKFEAKRLLDTRLADDAHGTTLEDFSRWKDELLVCLEKTLNLTRRDVGYEPSLTVTFDNSLDLIDIYNGEPLHHTSNGKAQETPTRPVPIKACRQLFQAGARNCVHMDLDIAPYPELVYKTGDHLAISLINPDQEVTGLLHSLGREESAETPLTIVSVDPSMKISLPTPTTLQALFRYYLELCAPVPRETVKALTEFAPTPEAKKFLTEICRDQDTFAQFQEKSHLTFSKLLSLATGGAADVTWSKLPLEFIVENIPRSHVRYYSISSSSVVSPRTASITALVSDTPLVGAPDESIPGVTTNYLLALSESLGQGALQGSHKSNLTFNLPGPGGSLDGGKLFAHIRRSTFKLPMSVKTPLIMAAAGTGIAPFRAFITERARMMSMGKELGDMVLFFGCRSPEEDFIYRQELEELERSLNGKLRLIPAFSRAEGVPKAYVQDKIHQFSDDVLRLIDEDATFYICGKTTMAKEIGAVVSAMVKEGDGDAWIVKMKKMNKWQEDVWG